MKAEIVKLTPCPRCGAAPGHIGQCLREQAIAALCADILDRNIGPRLDALRAVNQLKRREREPNKPLPTDK